MDWLGIWSDVRGYLIGCLLTGLVVAWHNQRQRHKLLGALRGSPRAPENLILVVWVGGRGDPLDDVRRYAVGAGLVDAQILSYRPQTSADLADQAVATAVIEDLREVIDTYGRGALRTVHLFYAGMVAYPFALGYYLSNWSPVVVYQLQDGAYRPLYRLDDSTKHRGQRLTSRLGDVVVATVTLPDGDSALVEVGGGG